MSVAAKNEKVIEFWFEFASNYSYLSVMRIGPIAASRGVSIVWRPFLLGPIFKSFGWDTSPFVLQKEKGAYMWNDMLRQCRKYSIPWKKPTTFPRLSVLPARIALAAVSQPWFEAFAKEVMLRNFAEDQDINSEPVMRDVLTGLQADPDTILTQAQSDENKLRLRSQTEAARSLAIFGAPTFFAKGEMFWGNDRLEDAIELAGS